VSARSIQRRTASLGVMPQVIDAIAGTTAAASQNVATIQAQLNGAGHIIIPAGMTFYLNARLTAPANTTIEMEKGSELRWSATAATGTSFLGTATRPGIEALGGGFRLCGSGKIRGPSVGVYVTNEIGLFAKGTSSLARFEGFRVVGDIEFIDWGYGGVLGQFLDDVDLIGVLVHDCGYLGGMFLSSGQGRIQRCRAHTITPGTSGNAYGFSLTHDSTAYSSDPNAGTNGRLAVNPFCNAWDVSANVVHDIPLWTGVDAHGGYELTIHDNAVYNCRHGILCGGGSGDASNYGGENKCVRENFVTTKRRDGSATTVSAVDRYGIIVSGGTTVRSVGCAVLGNTIEGYGDAVVSSYPIEATFADAVEIRGNVIRDWRGKAIYSAQGNGVITDNVLEGVNSATNSRCIEVDGPGIWIIHGNKHKPRSGTGAVEGLRVVAGSAVQNVDDNDFSAATTPYTGDLALMSGLRLSGTGSPEGVVAAPIGTLYSRTDGSAGTSLYVKESGSGNTGWLPIAGSSTASSTGTFTGTLTGCTTSPTGALDWSLEGDVVTLEIPAIAATSNTTAATITGMPAGIRPVAAQSCIGITQDNGVTAIAKLIVETSGVITLHVGVSATFTNTGTKGVGACTISYRRS